MLKLAAAAIWISAVTAGSVYMALQWPKSGEDDAEQHRVFGGLDYVRSEIISVPVLKQGIVDGYFLARLVYTALPADLASVKLPVEALLADEVYTYLYANPQIDFSDRDAIDVEGLRNGLRDSINARAGSKLVHDVLVEQMDYLRKNEVQSSSIRGPVQASGGNPPVPMR